ncbi:DUF2239 family protein [Paludibaculum fermentans]|uniref:DUF2239 family protein n=1 Tax=Paludibaculum fermentans TaxID=1473598 RepID=A0A7S7NU30_PALFE|nr:DUF2239 family protein [Paludibaculum fermentans]QOY89734.1 DUF2239 family protein [Paludibaculum fermentans]
MIPANNRTYTAFAGARWIAGGSLAEVAATAKIALDENLWAQVLIFDDVTSEVVDVDFRGDVSDVVARIVEKDQRVVAKVDDQAMGETARGPGRPRLGVVAREVTLLPRHWAWLASQPGGASVALRKLVEQASRANQGRDRRRHAKDSTYRFLSAMAGNLPGFEEATRALFADQAAQFAALVAAWPGDIGAHARKLAAPAFEAHEDSAL